MNGSLDRKLWNPDAPLCGVDEAGRGALAGPVAAAAVVMPDGLELDGVDDSKRLSPLRRERLSREIERSARAWAVCFSNHRVIDRDNILRATLAAMRRAVGRLRVRPGLVLVDGLQLPELDMPARPLVGGDRLSHSVACASILAKVHRDRLMVRLDRRYPGYGFARHKGYPTRQHVAALAELGASPVHRRSFAPVRRCLGGNGM